MRIGVDACTWSNRRGYGRFTRGLVTAMVEGHPRHEFVLVTDDRTAEESCFPDRAAIEIVKTVDQPTRAASADGSRRVIDMWRMSRAVARVSPDVFLFPTQYSYYPMTASVPTVVTFHDATAEQYPELIFSSVRSHLFWRLKTRLALFQADELVTVSQDARSQIAEVFDRQPDSIAVVTEGPDPLFGPVTDARQVTDALYRFGLPTQVPLLLYVGGISPHKNLQALLKALADLKGPWHLALVGDYQTDSFLSCYTELLGLASSLGLADRVSFTGFVSDERSESAVQRVYSVLVMLSMSEGFGLPVVEAMACGLPVVASNRGSIPEVLADAGVLIEAQNPEEITSALRRVLDQDSLRVELRRKGLERARLFSWERGARRMVAVLETAGGRARKYA